MDVTVLRGPWAVCRLPANHAVPEGILDRPFASVTRTADELSFVVPDGVRVPGASVHGGMALLAVAGPLPFTAVGVLASLAGPLANAGVALLAIGTFDTDYLLVAEASLPVALDALRDAGHRAVVAAGGDAPARVARMAATSGYAIVRSVLDEAACTVLGAAVDAWTAGRSRAGARGILACPEVRGVAESPCVAALAAAVLGEAARPFRATLFEKAPGASWSVTWHQDTALPLRRRVDAPGWGPWSTKLGVLHAHALDEALARVVAIRIHLDDDSADRGPLRVLPGSHERGRLDGAAVDAATSVGRVVPCLVPRGGVLVMRPLLLHASSRLRGAGRRRVIHVEYAPVSGLAPGIELAEVG